MQQIWDLPLRTFHWSLVLAIIFSYATSQMSGEWLSWHISIGIFIFALMLFRIIWGFVGTTTARFKTFFPTYSKIKKKYYSDNNYIGHSLLGSISVFALILLIFSQAALGFFVVNDEIDINGPLYDLVSSDTSYMLTGLHSKLFDVLLVMIAIHLLAIAYYSIYKKRNIVTPMVTGKIKTKINNGFETKLSINKLNLFLTFSCSLFTYWLIDSGYLLMVLLDFTK